MSVDRGREATERALVAAARRGDPDAVDRLYRAHYGAVAMHVRRLVGDDPDADDLVQETFVAALGSLRGFRGDARLSTWLHGVTLRVVRRHWRRRRSRRAHAAAYAEARAATAPPSEPTRNLERREEVRRLYVALDRLSPKLREAFVLRHVEALPLDEAAAVAGVRAATLAVRCHRAVAQLRSLGFGDDRAGETHGDHAGARPGRRRRDERTDALRQTL